METELIFSKNRERNQETYGISSKSCIACGRHTAEKQFVQMTTRGDIVDTDKTVHNSQGFFPIGPECAKKYPTTFIFSHA